MFSLTTTANPPSLPTGPDGWTGKAIHTTGHTLKQLVDIYALSEKGRDKKRWRERKKGSPAVEVIVRITHTYNAHYV